MQVEFGDDAQRGQVVAQRVAPAGEARPLVGQFERADPGVIDVIEQQARLQRPLGPLRLTRRAGEQAAVGDDDETLGETQAAIEVGFKPGLDLFAGGEPRFHCGGPASGKHRFVAGRVLCVGDHRTSIPQGPASPNGA